MASIKWPTVSIISTGSSGGISGGSNAGAGEGVFRSVFGTELTFKSIVGSSDISVTSNANEVIVALAAGSIITDGQNLGSGQEIFTSKSGTDLLFRTLIGGDNVNLVSGSNTITINAVTSSVKPGITTIKSLGVGEQINTDPSGSLRTLVGGSNITLVSGSDSITINSISSGPTGIVQNTSLGGDESILGDPSGSFRGLTAGSNISLASGTNDITINSTFNAIQQNTSLGGESIISGPSGSFRGLVAGTNITLVSGTNSITINSTASGGGGISTLSTSGGDEQINIGPSGSLRGLSAGNGITLTSGTNDITFSLPAGVDGNVLQYNSSNVPVVVDRPLTTQYVVGPGPDEYSSINSAILAAQSDGNTYGRHNMCVILIKPNSTAGYTEDITLPNGFCLSSLPGDSPFDGLTAPVQILGTITMNGPTSYALLNGIMVRTTASNTDAIVMTNGFLGIHNCTIQTLGNDSTALNISVGTVTLDGSTQLLAFGSGASYAIERTSDCQIIAYSSGVRIRATSGIAILDSGGLYLGSAGILLNGPEIVGQIRMTANSSVAQGALLYNTVHSVITNDAPFRITSAGSGTPGVNTNGSTGASNSGFTLNGISIRNDGGNYSGPYIQVDSGVCRLYLGYVTCDDNVASLDPVNDGIHVLNQNHDTDGNASYIRKGIVSTNASSGSVLVYDGEFLWDVVNTGSLGGSGATELNDLTDVNLTAFTPNSTGSNGEVLYYSGSTWSAYTPYHTRYTVGSGSLYQNFSDVLPLIQSENPDVVSVRFMPGIYNENIELDFNTFDNCRIFEIMGPSPGRDAQKIDGAFNANATDVLILGCFSASIQPFAFGAKNISISNMGFYNDSTVSSSFLIDGNGSDCDVYLEDVAARRNPNVNGTDLNPMLKFTNVNFSSRLDIRNCDFYDSPFILNGTEDISNIINIGTGSGGSAPEIVIKNSRISQNPAGAFTYPSGTYDGCIFIQNSNSRNLIEDCEIFGAAVGININSLDGFSRNPIRVKGNTISARTFDPGTACVLYTNSLDIASGIFIDNIFEEADSGIKQDTSQANQYVVMGNSFQISSVCINIPASAGVFLDYASNNYGGLPIASSSGNFFSDRGTPSVI